MILRRKVIWLVILMVWVGLVTSIIVYQGDDFYDLERVTTGQMDFSGGVEIIEQDVILPDESRGDVNFAKAKEEDVDKNFFIDYRLEREKARSEQINLYREMINNPNTDDNTKKEAQRLMLALSEKMEREMEIESLIRARGYKDALAYIHDQAVDVIVHTNGLEREDVARIGDIIIKVSGFRSEDVTIIEKKIN
ncbi:SpoIIIAH-like family protein [Natronospora cellulosivora (SeqCode)]